MDKEVFLTNNSLQVLSVLDIKQSVQKYVDDEGNGHTSFDFKESICEGGLPENGDN